MTTKDIMEIPLVQDHKRLKKEYCNIYQQQEKLLKSHVLLINMLAERNERIKELEQEIVQLYLENGKK